MIDTVVDMDEVRVFYVMDELILGTWMKYKKEERKVAVQVSEEILERYEKARKEFFAVSGLLEHAYRKQEGMDPLLDCPPEFK